MPVRETELAVVLPPFGNRDQLPELMRRLVPNLARSADPWEIVFVDARG